MKARGWAVAANGVILVPTVSPTSRGAMVNWLVVSVGFMVTNDMRDELITGMFERYSKTQGATLVEVEITS